MHIFNALINVLLMHPGPLRRRVLGVKLPGPRNIWGGSPVDYKKLETHFKHIINNNCRHSHQNNYLLTVVMKRQLEFSYVNSFDCQITTV